MILQSHARFVAEVSARAKVADDDLADRALIATLRALGRRMGSGETAILGECLPSSLADELRGQPFSGVCDLPHFVDQVGEEVGVDRALAHELVEVICGLLGEIASPTARSHLHTLPPDYVALFDAHRGRDQGGKDISIRRRPR